MNKETILEINKLLEGSDCCVIATRNGSAVIGNKATVLSCLTAIISNMRDINIEDELIKKTFDLASKNVEELQEELLNKIKQLLNKLGGKHE